MKNEETWKFAHKTCGGLWWKLGVVMLIISALIHVPFYGASDDALSILSLIVTMLQLALIIASIFVIESALKKKFNEDGSESAPDSKRY